MWHSRPRLCSPSMAARTGHSRGRLCHMASDHLLNESGTKIQIHGAATATFTGSPA